MLAAVDELICSKTYLRFAIPICCQSLVACVWQADKTEYTIIVILLIALLQFYILFCTRTFLKLYIIMAPPLW